MSGTLDLDIDTYWIRRASSELDEAAQCFGAASSQSCVPISSFVLGRSEAFAAAVAMAGTRNDQAHAASSQLQAVAAAVSRQLFLSAETFDRIEASTRAVPR